MFENIITSQMKTMFDDAIKALLTETALTIPCVFKYAGSTNQNLCHNCIFDPISKRSANLYNGTGPDPFYEGQICPVCQGFGLLESDASENINIAVIFDSKYFINAGPRNINIPDGTIQTLCVSTYMNSIKNCSELVTTVENILYSYRRVSEPQPMGFGNTNFIMTMWQRQ